MNYLRADFDFGDLAETSSAELLGSSLTATFSFPLVGPAGSNATAPVQSVAGRTGAITLAVADVSGAVSTTDLRLGDARNPLSHTHPTSDIVNFGTAAAAAAPVQSVAGRTGIVTLAKADVGLGNVDNTSDLNKPISTATQTALDGKQASGTYATLVGGTVPSNQLPSFVDDVLEYANLAGFPATGESGKIYVAIDTRKTYRWSGSAYVEISPSEVTSVNGATGAVTLAVADVSGAVSTTDLRLSDARNPLSHTHPTADIVNFGTAAAAAAPVQSVAGRTGAITLAVADVSGVVSTTDLRLSDARNPLSHTHPTSDIVNFGTAAAAAAPVQSVAGRTGAITLAVADVSGAVSTTDLRLSDARNPLSHTHPTSDIVNFGTAAAAAAPVQSVAGRTGAITLAVADVSGLQTGLDGKAASSHTHPASAITDFASAVNAASPYSTYKGDYDNGASYAIGDVVRTPSGSPYGEPNQLFVRVSNPANPGYPPGTSSWSSIHAAVSHTHPASQILDLPVELVIACSDEINNLTVGASKVTFRSPYAFTLTGVRASVNTAPTGSTLVVDVNKNGTSVLSTKLSLDVSEKTSLTADSVAVISDSSIADDAEITIDIDQIGSTIPGNGLKVVLIGTRT